MRLILKQTVERETLVGPFVAAFGLASLFLQNVGHMRSEETMKAENQKSVTGTGNEEFT